MSDDKLDVVIERLTVLHEENAKILKDHEARIRALEKWYFKALGALAVIVILAELIMGKAPR